MRASIRARIIRWVTGRYVKSINAEHADIGAMRRRWALGSKFLLRAFGVRAEATTIAGLHAEWLRPRQPAANKLLLYLHGGAYVLGGCATHRQFVSHLARAGGITALVPEYRLAPEHRFPAAIEDATSVYRELLASGYRAEDILVAGDSAGGGLSVATLLALRDAGEPLPAAAILFSPFLDFSGSGESLHTRAANDPWFKPDSLPVVADYYCGDDDIRNPLISPVFADVTGLPPMLIQVGEDEILLSDSVRLEQKLREAGVAVELEIWPDMWHVFQMFIRKMPESWQAIQRVGDYIRERTKS